MSEIHVVDVKINCLTFLTKRKLSCIKRVLFFNINLSTNLLYACLYLFCSVHVKPFFFIGSVTHCVRFSDDNKVQHGSPIDLDGVPFMIVGSKLMECHQGPHRRKSKETQANG
jgi:hypothetical protein